MSETREPTEQEKKRKHDACMLLAAIGVLIADETAVCLDCGQTFGCGLNGLAEQAGHDCPAKKETGS